jgi:hypothetical protein
MRQSASFGYLVLVSAVFMSLGWGLRGYIGGGPLGALIPGAFIAIWLCILLGLDPRRTALVAVFGTVGVAFGGDMTYGQTLGFLRDNDTLLRGLLGTVVKGGAWGLLGGAMLGLGFIAHQLDARRVATVLGMLLLAAFLGLALVNEPKLIYFSDPVNKPRAEAWAGLLFAGIAVLLTLRAWGLAEIPGRFALHGLVGGAAGFGIGGAMMALGFRLEAPLRGLPWWKFMEFTFGAYLGAAFGLAAWRLRERLANPALPEAPAPAPGTGLVVGIVLAAVGMIAWIPVTDALMESAAAPPLAFLSVPAIRVLLSFTTLGCVLIWLGHRSPAVAWHTALTLTFLHSVIDLQEDLGPEGGLDYGPAARWGLVVAALVVSAALVARWQRNPGRSLVAAVLLLMWGCMAVAYARLGANTDVLAPSAEILAAQGGLIARYLHQLTGHAIVHGIFTACAVVVTIAALRLPRAAASA